LWHHHPGVRSGHELSIGEKAADRMRNSMGSWTFVFSALAFLGLWMFTIPGRTFDHYPFVLLNLVLSCLAALQGAILLVAAKRGEQIQAELAMHHYQETSQHEDILKAIKSLLEQNTALTEQIAQLRKES
jgi:uncharacterized membrane protein